MDSSKLSSLQALLIVNKFQASHSSLLVATKIAKSNRKMQIKLRNPSVLCRPRSLNLLVLTCNSKNLLALHLLTKQQTITTLLPIKQQVLLTIKMAKDSKGIFQKHPLLHLMQKRFQKRL